MEHTPDLEEGIRLAALSAGWELSQAQLALALLHVREMLVWNRVAHLTTVTDPAGIAGRHFHEAFQAAALLPAKAGDSALRVADIGSGAGFPGLVVKLARPDIALTLLEPRERKAAFLAAIARHLAPPQTVILRKRAEDLAGAAGFDVVMSRAVRLRPRILEGILAPGGLAMLFGPADGDELIAALESRAWSELARRDLAIPGQVVRSMRRPP